MRKWTSSNAQNEARLLRDCAMAHTLSVLGGRWKPTILFALLDGKRRYSELRKSIQGISERMLVAQLRELEADGLLRRTVHPEVPPRVEYELTELGQSTKPILLSLSAWGEKHRQSAPGS